MNGDLIDLLIEQWRAERPDLDPGPMAVVGRILRAAALLERRLTRILAPLGLKPWAFDVLATLRRHGPPYRMPPKRLLESVMLTSGALTNRLDRLEAAGWIRRLDDPDDRRGVLVALTDAGLELVDQAVEARFEEARDALKELSPTREKQLTNGLRRLDQTLEKGEKRKEG